VKGWTEVYREGLLEKGAETMLKFQHKIRHDKGRGSIDLAIHLMEVEG